MLARNVCRSTALLLLASAALSLTACASHPEPQLISDGTTGRESALPWNRQEKWEATGQAGALAEQMQSR